MVRAQVQLANNDGGLVDRQRKMSEIARDYTCYSAMGFGSLSVPVQLTDKLDYKPVDIGGAEAAAEARARRSRLEIRARKQREAVARLNTSAVEAERLPTVSTFGDYSGIGRPKLGLEPSAAGWRIAA